jgi:hypothetical protein
MSAKGVSLLISPLAIIKVTRKTPNRKVMEEEMKLTFLSPTVSSMKIMLTIQKMRMIQRQPELFKVMLWGIHSAQTVFV